MMRMVDLIEKKRDGGSLSTEEIQYVVDAYTEDRIPDYQASALLMAIYFEGMNDRETRDLTLTMAHSGEMLDLSDVAPLVVDKHSTGGVGDKVSLVVAPVVAACGLPVGKMSGRGLGFSGGTLDKLESIPGYRVDLTVAEFKDQISRIGIVLTGQSGNLAPADGKLYALRDVTATVSSMPLIISSIMSKKLAGGANAIVLDVKVGSGAFMRTLDSARELAEGMVRIGEAVGREVTARISDMNQPLGSAVGNSLEVKEALRTLRNEGPEDFRNHCLTIAAEMLILGQAVSSVEEGKERALTVIESGDALEKFRELVITQEGDGRYVDEPERFPEADVIDTLAAWDTGTLAEVRADEIGLTVVGLGGGRTEKGELIDHRVGLIMHARVGDTLERGQPLVTVHAASQEDKETAFNRLKRAITLSDAPIDPLPLFYDRIR
jgi:pyrimidine-nucleoside phosphorylase